MQALTTTIDDVIEAYELAHIASSASLDVADYMPPESHPQFCSIAVELLRVDLEYQFESGQRPKLDSYLRRFPLVFDSEAEIRLLAFEHFRLCKRAGIKTNADQYARDYRIETDGWQTQLTTKRSVTSTNINSQPIHVRDNRLVPGFEFENFVLQEPIGEGALGQVFLARQAKVANRKVVLKFQPETALEVARLGRLQHPNIVPILSVHPYSSGSAICMPYLGRRTLRHVLSGDSEIDTVKLGLDLTAALEHAHERGVMHSDIKPANILISDDGPAMLLDFNLAGDLSQTPGIVGGTPAYMSPEHKTALDNPSLAHRLDHRSDLYSLGVVLDENLNGHQLSKTVASQRPVRHSVALNAIIEKCLAGKPCDRYQSATELLEDLQRHREDHPLKHQPEPSHRERFAKWIRRNPRGSSAVGLCLLFAVILFGVATTWRTRSNRIAAQKQHVLFVEEASEIRSLLALNDSESGALTEGLQRGRHLLSQVAEAGSYTVSRKLSANERQKQTQSIGEVLFYLAQASHRLSAAQASESDRHSLVADSHQYNRLAVEWFEQHTTHIPRAVAIQHNRLHGSEDKVEQPGKTINALDQLLLAIELNQAGQFEETIEYLDELKSEFADDASFWNLLGSAYAGIGQFKLAESCFTTCVAFKPNSWIALCNRGLARMANGEPSKAIGDFTHVIELRPHHWSGYLNRAIAQARSGRLRQAVKDLNNCQTHNGPTRVYFLRARYLSALGDHEAAQADQQAGLKATPTDPKSWIARGVARLSTQPEVALDDFREAVRVQPDSADGLRNIAHVLSEHLQRPAEAIATLTTLIENHPTDAAAYTGRAVLFARSGQEQAAIIDVRKALRLSTSPLNQYQAACVYALLSETNTAHTKRAFSLLATAFEEQPSLVKFSETDPDLILLTKTPTYDELVSAARAIRRMKVAK